GRVPVGPPLLGAGLSRRPGTVGGNPTDSDGRRPHCAYYESRQTRPQRGPGAQSRRDGVAQRRRRGRDDLRGLRRRRLAPFRPPCAILRPRHGVGRTRHHRSSDPPSRPDRSSIRVAVARRGSRPSCRSGDGADGARSDGHSGMLSTRGPDVLPPPAILQSVVEPSRAPSKRVGPGLVSLARSVGREPHYRENAGSNPRTAASRNHRSACRRRDRASSVRRLSGRSGCALLVLGQALHDNGRAVSVWLLVPSLVDNFWKQVDAVAANFARFGVTNIRHLLRTTQNFVGTWEYGVLAALELTLSD